MPPLSLTLVPLESVPGLETVARRDDLPHEVFADESHLTEAGAEIATAQLLEAMAPLPASKGPPPEV